MHYSKLKSQPTQNIATAVFDIRRSFGFGRIHTAYTYQNKDKRAFNSLKGVGVHKKLNSVRKIISKY